MHTFFVIKLRHVAFLLNEIVRNKIFSSNSKFVLETIFLLFRNTKYFIRHFRELEMMFLL